MCYCITPNWHEASQKSLVISQRNSTLPNRIQVFTGETAAFIASIIVNDGESETSIHKLLNAGDQNVIELNLSRGSLQPIKISDGILKEQLIHHRKEFGRLIPEKILMKYGKDICIGRECNEDGD